LLVVVLVDLFLLAKNCKFTADLWSRDGPQKSFFIFFDKRAYSWGATTELLPKWVVCGGLEETNCAIATNPKDLFTFQNFSFPLIFSFWKTRHTSQKKKSTSKCNFNKSLNFLHQGLPIRCQASGACGLGSVCSFPQGGGMSSSARTCSRWIHATLSLFPSQSFCRSFVSQAVSSAPGRKDCADDT
jgi:hypothetical protein